VKEKLIFKLELKENAKNWKVFYRQSVMEGNANDNCTRVRRVVSSFNIFKNSFVIFFFFILKNILYFLQNNYMVVIVGQMLEVMG
jgi:hypothetical protein